MIAASGGDDGPPRPRQGGKAIGCARYRAAAGWGLPAEHHVEGRESGGGVECGSDPADDVLGTPPVSIRPDLRFIDTLRCAHTAHAFR